jgi:hypothetical protein
MMSDVNTVIRHSGTIIIRQNLVNSRVKQCISIDGSVQRDEPIGYLGFDQVRLQETGREALCIQVVKSGLRAISYYR